MSFRCPVCKTISFNLIRPTCDRCKRRMVDESENGSSDSFSDIATAVVYSSFSSDSSSDSSSSSDSGSCGGGD